MSLLEFVSATLLKLGFQRFKMKPPLTVPISLTQLDENMNFVGTGKKLDDIDLPKIGRLIGVGEDEIHAVIDVESRGYGFDSQKRLIMLFEPHIFYRLLSAQNPSKLPIAIAKGVAYKSWGQGSYPKDSYPRLLEAVKVDLELALQSASWGLGQIMGFNYALCGFKSAKEMVENFMLDEEYQLEAMIKFIISAGLADELRNHDWRGFARGYNGPGYAKNGYHTKLRQSFIKWQRIRDTKYP